MTAKTALYIAGSLILLPAVLTLGYRELRNFTSTAQAASTTPYTLKLQERIKWGSLAGDPDQSFKIAREITIAVKADGSRVEHEVFSPRKANERWARTVVFSDNRHVKVWGPDGLKSTGVPWTTEAIHRQSLAVPTAESNCMETADGRQAFVGYEYLGKEWIGDILAVKISRNAPHAAVNWHAPEFGCVQVRRTIEFKACCTPGQTDSGGRATDSSELLFLGITRGEPDPSWFDVSKFKESAPTTANAAHLRAAGFPEEYVQKVVKELKASDESYWALRDRAGIRPDR